MEASRANSPIAASTELYDHRHQPDSLPVRGSSFSDSVHSGVHNRSASVGSVHLVRPRLDSFSAESAIYDGPPSDYDGEGEQEHADNRSTRAFGPSLRRKTSNNTPQIRPGQPSLTVPVITQSVEFSTPSSPPKAQRSAGGPNLSEPVNASRGRRSRRHSNNEQISNARRPTFTESSPVPSPTQPHRGSVEQHVDEKRAAIAKERRMSKEKDDAATVSSRRDSDSDSEAPSRANSDYETEEDVCFPMPIEHQRINGIDFQEIEEYAAAQRLEQWYPSLTRRADNDFGGRRMTFSSTDPSSNVTLSAAVGVAPAASTTTSSNAGASNASGGNTSSDSEKSMVDDIEMMKSKMLPPGVAAKFAEADDRFSLFCSDNEETIHAPEICLLTAPDQSFADLFDKRNGTWWLDCMDPTDAEMKMLSKTFGIHPLTTEDIRVQETREKVELFRSYYFVCFRTFEHEKESNEFLEPLNMYVIVFRDGILSFHFSRFDHTANVRRRIRQLRDYVSVSADWICYALIDDIVDGFAPIIHEVEKEADGIEDSVFVARESDFGHMLRRIGDARKTVMTLMRLLSGKADVIKMFAKRCNEQWDVAPKGEIGLYLGDIQDHIVTMYQNLSAYEKILSRSHANYLAQLQVQSFHANNRITNMLSKVTLIGTILVPLNLITGLFGMNVHVPGEGQSTLGWFFGIVGVIAFIVTTSYFIARRWLRLTEQEQEPAVRAEADEERLLSSA
ncbi:uncharacterized protein V1516DRAFT_618213 [Lipomyces oligophaga]|uniref:uncharacterized protein n=1 Tax=Lipomyces oligophaga TaxID=45792 RepID=UPI0034CD63CE